MGEISILIVDDHSLFREGLSRLLEAEAGFRIAGECSSTGEAFALAEKTPPDIILLDYDLGEDLGTNLLEEFKTNQGGPKILVVTAGVSDEITLHMIEAGASGVFLKHNSPHQLVAAIRMVANGEVWLDRRITSSLVKRVRESAKPPERVLTLTSRQEDVLRGILDGLANKEIASRLNVSESSVKAVIQELFRKAGVRTRSQLVRIAVEKHSSDWLKER